MLSGSSGMEVDPPPPPATSGSSSVMTTLAEHLGLNPLKRSNSAPMLACSTVSSTSTMTRAASPVLAVSTATHSQSLTPNSFDSFPKHFERVRRYSTSSTGLFSPGTPVKNPSRLAQLINEERLNVKEREEAHERENNTNLMISTSCDELSLSDPSDPEPMVMEVLGKRPRSFQEPLHIFTSPYPYASSPSPTRLAKQCFSPSLCLPLRATALSPNPSPTRKSFSRRSISPISMPPSRIMLKRKINMDSEMCETPIKRYQPGSFTCISPGTSTPYNSHPLSISSSSFSDSGSPEQQVPIQPLHRPLASQPCHNNNHLHRLLLGGGGNLPHLSLPPSSSSPTPPSSNSNSPMLHGGSTMLHGGCGANINSGNMEIGSNALKSSNALSLRCNKLVGGGDDHLHGQMQGVNTVISPSERGIICSSSNSLHVSPPSLNTSHHRSDNIHVQQQHSPMVQSDSFQQYQQQHSHSSGGGILTPPGNVFGFHPVQDSLDSMSSGCLSSLSHESTSDTSELMNDDIGDGSPVGVGGNRGEYNVLHHASKPSQV